MRPRVVLAPQPLRDPLHFLATAAPWRALPYFAVSFAELDLPPEEGDRRVRAILTYPAER